MSLGWLSIGATGDINLTGLNVDTGTLYVDKVNNRVGIRTDSPGGVLQVDSPTGNLYSLNPLSSSGVAVFSSVKAAPKLSPTGNTDFGGTLWINSTAAYARNSGASIALGGRAYDSGSGSEHMTFARMSGIQTTNVDDLRGDYVVETAYDGKLYERLRVRADGKVGLGVSEPSGGLHLLSDVISTGVWNSGYRRDTPTAFLTPGQTAKVPVTPYATLLQPTTTNFGWLGRIDGTEYEYIYSIAANPANGDIYAVGLFTGTLNFYADGSQTALGTSFTASTQTVYLVKYNDAGTFQWAAKLDSAGVTDWGFGVALIRNASSPNSPSVIVTGPFAVGGTFTAYDKGSAGAAFGTTLSNVGGGHTGFIAKYDSSGNVQAVAKIDIVGNVVPTVAEGYGTNSFYVAGYYDRTSGDLLAYNASGVGVISVTTYSSSFDSFICKYDENLNPLWIRGINGAGVQVVDYNMKNMAVNQATGDIYLTGYYSGTTTFYNTGVGTVGATLTHPGGTSSSFLVKYDTSGIVQWASKITSDVEVVARGVGFSSAGYVYVVGDFKGTVTFSSGITQQSATSSPSTTDRIAFLTQYDSNGTNLWSTKCQLATLSGVNETRGMSIDCDSYGNAYIAVDTIVASVSTSPTLSIFQRSAASSPCSTIVRHTLSGIGGFVGMICYNPDGKVLYTSKVNSTDFDRTTSMRVYQRSGGDTYPRVVLGCWTQGREVSITDASGDTFRYLTGLSNVGNSTPPSYNTAMIIQLPSTPIYTLDSTSDIGTTKKFINTTAITSYVVPFVDISGSIESAYTDGIFAVGGNTSLEIIYTSVGWNQMSNKPSSLSVYQGNVGIGTTLPSNLLQVDGSTAVTGNVGIGTKTSGYQLDVYSNSKDNWYASQIRQVNANSGGLYVLCSNTTSATQKALTVRTNGTNSLVVNGDGTVNLNGSSTTIAGTTNMTTAVVSGSLTVTGGVTGAVPPGTITMYGGISPAPSGWLLCNGNDVSRTTYANLFAAIGTNYGVGDNSTTFNVPDLRAKFPIGYHPSGTLNPALVSAGFTQLSTMGGTGGTQMHTLTVNEIPSHEHTLFTLDNNRGGPGGFDDGSQGITGSTKTTSSTGGGGAHNNMPPYIVVNYIIKT